MPPGENLFRNSLVAVLTTLRLKSPIQRVIRGLVTYGIPKLRPEVLAVLPHDSNAFTQGLVFTGGRLYESTGMHGCSSLRCINTRDGSLLQVVSIDDDVWAEGVAVDNGRLVQLTWVSGKAFCFSLPDLKRIGELNYEGEGWGITANGSEFIMSDGSNVLLFRDNNFRITARLSVRINRLALKRLNDIQYVDGVIYANVLYDNNIYVISLQSGRVTHMVDCTALVDSVETKTSEQVLNGIAHDPEENVFFITGKQWRTLFKVRIPDLRRSA